MINVLFSATPERWEEYQTPLAQAFQRAGLDVALSQDHDPQDVDYIVFAPNGPVSDFTPFVRTKAVLGLWAGVETIVTNQTLTQPLARMVDSGLSEGMVEWVTGHVLRHHLGMDAHILGQNGQWIPEAPPMARDRKVTILGLGALGSACATALAALNFQVTGWSRSPKTVQGVTCLAGAEGLITALEGAEILVLLLPQTPQTVDLIDRAALARMPKGAVIINPARGPMIVDQDLLDALDSGQIAHATLDVFREEPLPPSDPFWSHPKVTVTPHIASATRADTASAVIAENIRRGEAHEPFLNLVDRKAGY